MGGFDITATRHAICSTVVHEIEKVVGGLRVLADRTAGHYDRLLA